MWSVGVCVLLIIMDGPGEKRLASVKRYEGDRRKALLRLGCGRVLAARSGGPFEPIFAIGVADRGNSCQLGDAPRRPTAAQASCRDLGTRPELRTPNIAAQTRIVSVAEIRPGPRKSVRPFKGIFWDDISEFESSLPGHAVGSLWRVYPVHGLCEQRLDLSRQNFAARLDQRDFRDQFFDEHIAKRIEVSCDQDKSTGPTDHVLSIVVFKPPWRIRVFRSPQGVGENNQAVDRNPSPNCLVSRRAHITAAIVIAVSRHIDCTPRGVDGRTRELRQGKIEPAADGRAVGKRTGYFQQLISKLPGAIQVLDQGPIDDESL